MIAQPTCLSSGAVKHARKRHTCDACRGPIEIGQPYEWQVNVHEDADGPYRFRWHPGCDQVWETDHPDDYPYQDVSDLIDTGDTDLLRAIVANWTPCPARDVIEAHLAALRAAGVA